MIQNNFLPWDGALSWEGALFLRVILGFGIASLLLKWITNKGRRTERFLWQFVFAFGLAAVIALYEQSIQIDAMFIAFVGLGALGTYGTFYAWKAIAISQSRNALFTFWDDIIAMALSWTILREGIYVTPIIAFGLFLSFMALIFFIRHGWKKSYSSAEITVPIRFYGYVAMYSVLWGITYFGQRYWALLNRSPTTFAFCWYLGGAITATLIYFFYKDSAVDQQNKQPIRISGLAAIFALAVVLYLSMTVSIVAYKAPQVIVQPIFFVSEMILPALIGLYIFHERRQLDYIEWLYFALGFIGALIIGANFRRLKMF